MVQLSSGLDDLATKLHAYQQQAAPYTDSMVAQVSEAVEPLRASIQADIDALKVDLAPKTKLIPIWESIRAKLMERVQNLQEMATPYIEEYREQVTKAITEAREKASTMDADQPRAQVQGLGDHPNVAALKEKLNEVYKAINDAINKQ